MAVIIVKQSMPPVDGMEIKFMSPGDCEHITGLRVSSDDGDYDFTFRDCHGSDLFGVGNLFRTGAYLSVILDVNRGYAYIQNADNNSYIGSELKKLKSAVLNTYANDGANLTGSGVNGKFKATTSGTISMFNVNGVACSVRCGEESSIDLIAGNWYTFILDGDTVNFSSGGAGGGLNFRVVGGTSEPASPSENTIWINTDVPVSGYEFSATAPAAPVQGMVWVTTGTSSNVEFNALKKNGIKVYPLSAKQYIDGAFVGVEAKSYQDGRWVEWWTNELYTPGTEWEHITGGWKVSEWRYSSQSYSAGAAITTEQADGLRIVQPESTSGAFITELPVDLTNYSRIVADITNVANMEVMLAVCDTIGTYSMTSAVVSNKTTNGGTLSIDVSGLSGNYFVYLAFIRAQTVILHSIRME